MVVRTMSLPPHEIEFLKETLHAQQELLQKLYNELDEERESSSVAADEALSMILRLQGEKAAMGMEASQYKRIAEEKMCHAQETLEIFQELIYQKEMQIASLEFQVQAYKFKLISMGCDDLGACEMQYPENMLSRKNRVSGETSSLGSLRRGSSLPPPPVISKLGRRVSAEGTTSSTSSPKTWQETRGEEPSIRREQGDVNSYWDEIKKLNDRVNELDTLKNYSSLPTSKNMVSAQACRGSASSTSVQDIFEVPICYENNQGDTTIKNESHNLVSKSKDRNGKLDSVWDEIWNTDVKESTDWEKKSLLSPNNDKSSPRVNDANEKIDLETKLSQSSGGSNESPKPKDGKASISSLYKHSIYGVDDFELQQFNRRLKQLEDQRFLTKGIGANTEMVEEESRVLWEIRDKIDSLQAEITELRTKKPFPPADRSPGCIKEVFLCFWP
ncbi:unnamed protein product [Amaranthus hypochondriacus]